MGVSGACRCCELTNLKISDVEDRGAYLIVSIPDTKTGVSRKFTILEEGFSINTVEKCRKYMSLRPKKLSIERFFLRYAKQKCTSQPVGINTLSKVPSIVFESGERRSLYRPLYEAHFHNFTGQWRC
jgi:hypothetical protein